MLRLNILASAVPLAIAALFARAEFSTGPRACIEIAGTSVRIATLSWQAQRHVSFTCDASRDTSVSFPVIYLSRDGPADYRIFVSSMTLSPLNAAALIVGADGRRHRIDAASLKG